jgi:hypothetical protein
VTPSSAGPLSRPQRRRSSSEGRSSKAERSPKPEGRRSNRARPWVSAFGFRPSAFFRPSGFGLRPSKSSAFGLPPGSQLQIRYAAEKPGQMTLQINSAAQKVAFPATGQWQGTGAYAEVTVPVRLPSAATVRLVFEPGDAAANIDSVRGQCRTARRQDRWFGNPKGIVSSSPGLPSQRGYPGLAPVRFSTPTGLCPRSAADCNPKGIVSSSPATESARLPWVIGARTFLSHAARN